MKKQNVCWALIYVHKFVLICMRNVVGEEKNYIDNIITALFSSPKFKKVAEVYIYRYSYTNTVPKKGTEKELEFLPKISFSSSLLSKGTSSSYSSPKRN